MLDRLDNELISKGGWACLPRSLTDEWLDYLSASAEGMLTESESTDGEHIGGAACIKVVIHLLQQKAGDVAIMKVSEERLFECAQMFMIELGLEQVHRRTDMKYEPATLETIFTEREVRTWRDPEGTI